MSTTQEIEVVEQVELPGGRRVALRRREGGGVPVVLLHGLLDSSQGWWPVTERLSAPSLAVDLAGFGGSDLPTRPRISAYAEDVAAALRLLDIDRFVLVGHSLGGAVATAVAERMPDETADLVLLAPAGFGRIPMAELAALPGIHTALQRLLPVILASRTLTSAGYRVGVSGGAAPDQRLLDALRGGAGSLAPAAAEAVRAIVAAGLSPRAFHRRRVDYAGPVRVVWGSRDRVVPLGHVAAVEAAFEHVTTTIWPAMGHHPQRERLEELLAVLEHACAAAALPSLARRRGRADRAGAIPRAAA